MRKILKLSILFILPLFVFSLYFNITIGSTVSALPSLEVYAKSAVLIDANSGRILYGKNEHTALDIASTTKLMTALVAIENCENLDEVITVHDGSVGIEGTSIYLKNEERFSVRDLLYGLILASGNDASAALGYHIGDGNLNAFISMMNEKASELNLKNTNFATTHGLDIENHFSSSYDLAMIMREGLKHDFFRELVGTKRTEIEGKNTKNIRYLKNKVKPLFTYDYCIGGKTGFTDAAGRCMVSASNKDGFETIAVVLNCPGIFDESVKLFEYGYDNYENVEFFSNFQYLNDIPVESGDSSITKAYIRKGFSYPLTKEEQSEIKIEKSVPEKLVAPLEKDAIIGKIEIFLKKH